MKFDKNPKKPSKKRKKNMSNLPTNQLPPNNAIPKNNLGGPEEDSDPRADVFSPIPQYFRYTTNSPSHYQSSQFDWGEPSFGFGMVSSEDSEPQNAPSHQDNTPLKNNAHANDDIFNELYSRTSILNDEESQKRTTHPNRRVVQATPVPVQQNADNWYKYNSLEEAMNFWLTTLSVNSNTKSIYRDSLINFIKELDSEGIRKPSPIIIYNYCSENFSDDQCLTLAHFKSVLKRFLKWMSSDHTCNKINSHQKEAAPIKQPVDSAKNCKPKLDPAAQFINKTLSNAFNEWSKTLKSDVNTNAICKTQTLHFMMFLLQIKKLSPTLSDIQKYIQSCLENSATNDIETFKIAIKGFLHFLEDMAIPQDHEVYKFLDSINSKKTK